MLILTHPEQIKGDYRINTKYKPEKSPAKDAPPKYAVIHSAYLSALLKQAAAAAAAAAGTTEATG